ncbi:hypothetical protein ABZ348_03945 [Streptomyces sp. NPDC005963]|uniref:hypothetical protein n=1 Tax=Streptomyces sp. NPDC005963 TaxID=3156721 RepID=UPI0033E16F46
MHTFLGYLIVMGLLALLVLPSLIGHARDRAVDRQLRAAERGPSPTTRVDGTRPAAVAVRFTPVATTTGELGPGSVELAPADAAIAPGRTVDAGR